MKQTSTLRFDFDFVFVEFYSSHLVTTNKEEFFFSLVFLWRTKRRLIVERLLGSCKKTVA